MDVVSYDLLMGSLIGPEQSVRHVYPMRFAETYSEAPSPISNLCRSGDQGDTRILWFDTDAESGGQ